MPSSQRPANEILLSALREQNRKTDILIEINRLTQKQGAQSATASFLGGIRQSGVGGAVAGSLDRVFGPAAPGANSAAAGGAIGQVADIIKAGLESGFRASASVFRSASINEDRSLTSLKAGNQFGQGAKEGFLNMVPLVGPEAAARSNLEFRQKQREAGIIGDAAARTSNRLSPIAESLATYGGSLDPAFIEAFKAQDIREARAMDQSRRFLEAAYTGESINAILSQQAIEQQNNAKAQSVLNRGR